MKKEITIKVEKKNFFINVVQQTSKLKKYATRNRSIHQISTVIISHFLQHLFFKTVPPHVT